MDLLSHYEKAGKRKVDEYFVKFFDLLRNLRSKTIGLHERRTAEIERDQRQKLEKQRLEDYQIFEGSLYSAAITGSDYKNDPAIAAFARGEELHPSFENTQLQWFPNNESSTHSN